MQTKVITIIGLSIVAVIAGYFVLPDKEVTKEITTFEECAAAGYPIMESYPEQCRTPDGRSFIRAVEPVACTMDAKMCPDGSYVGRTGPKCEFAACPPGATGDQVSLKGGERDGPLQVEEIFLDYITGLVFREYPVATNQGSPITMRIGDTVSNGCTVTLTLLKIVNNTATFSKKTDTSRPCPICLAEGTLIDTLLGNSAVQDLKIGDMVWTKDLVGNRIALPILAVVKTPVPTTHEVVHVKLADGRELFVSPGHPVGDGRFMGDLVQSDTLDGSVIVKIETVAYAKKYTYDILPAGETGLYFANGILIGSTLLK